ncbi:MAG: tRNA-binding protein [Bdellovibrionales bacterium]|nr:tRNA-binding protein [Bdellovibrionales bacterium]
MPEISWSDFELVELRIGTIVRVEEFPEARKPAYKIWVDFGDFGEKKTSAQITTHYTKESLIGKQILGVTNFPIKQVGPFRSEFLLTGVVQEDGSVIIVQPEREVRNGLRLS